MNRIGLIGPAEDTSRTELRDFCELLLEKMEVDQAIYLGDATMPRVRSATHWASELYGGRRTRFPFAGCGTRHTRLVGGD